MTRFLERYGGFKDQRVWGLVQWQLAQIFDLLASEQVEGAKDVLALLMLMVDQTVLDSGHHELGWILSLQEDPPSQVFTAPQHSSSSFAHARTYATPSGWQSLCPMSKKWRPCRPAARRLQKARQEAMVQRSCQRQQIRSSRESSRGQNCGQRGKPLLNRRARPSWQQV